MKRLLSIGLLCLTALANAGWGTARYCRPNDSTFVIFKGKDTFILKSSVAWELADSKKVKAFQKWAQESDLPKDPGELVLGAPPEKKAPVVASMQLAATSASLVSFAPTTGAAFDVPLTAKSSGAVPDAAGAKLFKSFASQLKLEPSSLLVLLSGQSGKDLSEEKAWGTILKRLSGPQFFIYLGPSKGVIWGVPPAVVTSSKPSTVVSNTSVPTVQKPKPKKASDQPASLDPFIAFLAGVFGSALIVWAAIRFFVLGNPKASKLVLGDGKVSDSGSNRISAHERELVQKVRDEMSSPRRDRRSLDPEAAIVGKMMEAYDRYDALAQERDSLKAYGEYKDEYLAFKSQLDSANTDTSKAKSTASHLKKQLEQEQAKVAGLQSQLETANNEYRELQQTVSEADQLLDQFASWCNGAGERVQEISKELTHE